MIDEHVINLIEQAPLDTLSEGEMVIVRNHIRSCVACQQAFEVAQIAGLLLKERAATTVEPSPFFETRVMAALREKRAAAEQSSLWSMWNMWRAAYHLVTAMVVIVVALGAVAFLSPSLPQPGGGQEPALGFKPDLAEQVMLAQDSLPGEVTHEQVLATLYEAEEETGGEDE